MKLNIKSKFPILGERKRMSMHTELYPKLRTVSVEWKLTSWQMNLVVETPGEEAGRKMGKEKVRDSNTSISFLSTVTILLYDDEDIKKPSIRVSQMIKRAFANQYIESKKLLPVSEWNKAMGGVPVAYSCEEYAIGVENEIAKDRFITEVISGGIWKFKLKT